MHILIAPNAFKGTLDARAAARAIARGVLAVHSDWQIDLLPVADGGDGSLDVLMQPAELEAHQVEVTGADGKPHVATYGFRKRDGFACIEAAQACGFIEHSLHADAASALAQTTTYGVGELIMHALRRGARHIDLCIGGTATVDGGLGMAQALGIQMLDAHQHIMATPLRTGKIDSVADVQSGSLKLEGITVRALCDVTQSLCGLHGAARTFGPQKGAQPAQIARLDAALLRLYGAWRVGLPGLERGGAGGGIAAAAHYFLGATLVSGADALLDLLHFDAALKHADWIITGEGKLDSQTLHGKVPGVILERARRVQVRVAALAGRNELPTANGFAQVQILGDAGMTHPENALQAAAEALARRL